LATAVADRQYELVYILPPETTEPQATEIHDQLAAVVERLHGAVDRTENWGRKRLAYDIGHFKEGVYVLEVINGSGRTDERARSPAARDGSGVPSHDRPR
jgi:small subunit ribosomal protein S6